MGSPVVERAFSGDGSLDSKPKEPNHGEAGVLDFCQLEGGLLLWVSGQAERVKVLSTGVKPLLRVELCIPLELDVPNDQNLNPYQCGDGEWKRLAKVR